MGDCNLAVLSRAQGVSTNVIVDYAGKLQLNRQWPKLNKYVNAREAQSRWEQIESSSRCHTNPDVSVEKHLCVICPHRALQSIWVNGVWLIGPHALVRIMIKNSYLTGHQYFGYPWVLISSYYCHGWGVEAACSLQTTVVLCSRPWDKIDKPTSCSCHSWNIVPPMCSFVVVGVAGSPIRYSASRPREASLFITMNREQNIPNKRHLHGRFWWRGRKQHVHLE